MKRALVSGVLFALSLIVASVLPASADTAFAQEARQLIRTPPSLPPPTKNTLQTIEANKDLHKFAALIDDADLKDMFTGSPEEPVTVFVPTDDAIGDISRDDMKRIKASKTSLQSFIKYHIIVNSIVSSGAIKGRKASPSSANGEALSFDGTSKKDPPKINDASLVQGDIMTTNGVVHIVSAGLVPPSLKEAKKEVAQDEPKIPAIAPAPGSKAPATVTPPAASKTAPAEVVPTAKGSSAAGTTTGAPNVTSPAASDTPPPPAADTTAGDKKGFELFGHKFGW